MTVEKFNRESCKAWLEVASGDLRVAKAAMRPDTLVLRAVVFHAQQCAEKSIKTLFIRGNREIPRTHDLVVLADATRDVFDLTNGYEDLKWLSGWAVAGRYPGDVPEPFAEDARRAIDIAQRVFDSLAME